MQLYSVVSRGINTSSYHVSASFLFSAYIKKSGLYDFRAVLDLSRFSRRYAVAVGRLLCATLFPSLCHNTRHAVVHVPERPTASWSNTRFLLAASAPKSSLFDPRLALIGWWRRRSPHGAQLSRCSVPAPHQTKPARCLRRCFYRREPNTRALRKSLRLNNELETITTRLLISQSVMYH